jgi:hypothetical protein
MELSLSCGNKYHIPEHKSEDRRGGELLILVLGYAAPE